MCDNWEQVQTGFYVIAADRSHNVHAVVVQVTDSRIVFTDPLEWYEKLRCAVRKREALGKWTIDRSIEREK